MALSLTRYLAHVKEMALSLTRYFANVREMAFLRTYSTSFEQLSSQR